jgi:hypothetical protein
LQWRGCNHEIQFAVFSGAIEEISEQLFDLEKRIRRDRDGNQAKEENG